MTLKLADIEGPLEPVEFRDGSEHPVLPLDGVAAQMAVDLPDEGAARIEGMRRIVARCVPSASADQLEALTVIELDFLIAHASRQQDKVAEYLGKPSAEGGASSSATRSATPSRASRKRSAGARTGSGAGPTG